MFYNGILLRIIKRKCRSDDLKSLVDTFYFSDTIGFIIMFKKRYKLCIMGKLVTKQGLEKIKKELKNRKVSLRQKIADAIKEAKEQGDLSENAEYSEAKKQQAENEARISELEFMLKEATVVEYDKNSGVIQMGSKVKAKVDGAEMEIQIVGSNESNPDEMKISNESPLGKVLLGRTKGDKVDAITPGGKITYKILDVE